MDHQRDVVALLACRWESGQRLAMKLLLKLYEAASTAPAGTALGDAAAAAGGVSQDLVKAYQAVLEDSSLDGSFKVRQEGVRVWGDAVLCVVWGLAVGCSRGRAPLAYERRH
jgi:hypothetical protein